MGMVISHDLANDLGAFAIAAIRQETHDPHAIKHTAVGGFQPIAHVRKRPSNDHAHGVIHVRALHLVFNVY